MLTSEGSSAYKAAVADGATQAGLSQLVYMHLAKDLLRAAEAVGRQDIQTRCDASNHALLLLGHLESWTEDIREAGLAEGLRAFYRMLRSSLIALQATPSRSHFEQLSQLVLETSSAWRAKEESACLIDQTPLHKPVSDMNGNISFVV